MTDKSQAQLQERLKQWENRCREQLQLSVVDNESTDLIHRLAKSDEQDKAYVGRLALSAIEDLKKKEQAYHHAVGVVMSRLSNFESVLD